MGDDSLGNLLSGHAGLDHADEVVDIKTFGGGELEKIFNCAWGSHELLLLEFLQKQVSELVVGVIALHGATPFPYQFTAEGSVSENVLSVYPCQR
jgi:hypothetical protein